MTLIGSSTHDPMSMAKTPKQREFVRFLQSIEHMTLDDLRAAIAACPRDVRDRLEAGPLFRRFSCGVCEAFGRGFYAGIPDADDPRWRAWGYHEVPKLQMRRSDDRHYGELANETYRRSIATYRAAGWEGDAEEPNA
jgi:hypothetical protein